MKDIWDNEDKDLLNEHKDDNEIYEMQENNICNMAMSDPKGVENKGWTGCLSFLIRITKYFFSVMKDQLKT